MGLARYPALQKGNVSGECHPVPSCGSRSVFETIVDEMWRGRRSVAKNIALPDDVQGFENLNMTTVGRIVLKERIVERVF